MKWLISEIIDMDGGFGDAIPVESPLCIVDGTETEQGSVEHKELDSNTEIKFID